MLIGMRFRLHDLSIRECVPVLSGTPVCSSGRRGERIVFARLAEGHRWNLATSDHDHSARTGNTRRWRASAANPWHRLLSTCSGLARCRFSGPSTWPCRSRGRAGGSRPGAVLGQESPGSGVHRAMHGHRSRESDFGHRDRLFFCHLLFIDIRRLNAHEN